MTCLIASSCLIGRTAAEEAAATPADEVAQAKAAYEAAVQAAREAEAALVPLREAMQKADAAFAAASRTANEKRRRATEAKDLSGEPGVQELKRAEENLAAAEKELAEASEAKPPLDQALAEARAVAQPLQDAYNAAEKAAKEAEAAAKQAAEAADKHEIEAKKAADRANALRRAADSAKMALARLQQLQQSFQKQLDAAAAKIAELEAEKKPLDEALAAATNRVAAAKEAAAQAEKAAQEAEQIAKQAVEDAAKSDEEKKNVAAEAQAKRTAAEQAKSALSEAEAAQREAQQRVEALTQKLARPTQQKAMAESTLANLAKQLEAASAAVQTAEAAAQEAAKTAEEKRKLADTILAAAKAEPPADANVPQEIRDAAQEWIRLQAVAKQTAEDAAAKRKAANEAKAALDPAAKNLAAAATKASAAAQRLSQAETRKKTAEDELENLKKRIAEAKQTFEADEKAAQEAEALVPPLKEEADKRRAEYVAAKQASDQKAALVDQARIHLYRLSASRRIAALMESSEPPTPTNRIDEIVFAKLQSLGIQPVLCSDAVFVRRAYLDIIGELPTAEEAKAFIESTDKNKRAALVERLLDDTRHADYWAMRWSDIFRVKAEFPVKLWPNAAQAYYRWIWESLAQNKPYDRFARELLTSSGSNFRVGPVNFYRAISERTPEGIASAVALAFMGTRIDFWPEERRANMAVFFSQVGFKPTSEWKEEIVFWDPLKTTAISGSTAAGLDSVAAAVTATNTVPKALPEPLAENGPQEAVFPDGTKTTLAPDRDPREVFADWLIRPENPWFAKTIANRTWAWAMGRGIIHEPDDIRDDNPPANPELLAYLEQELTSSGFDLKHLKRLIFSSTTYQLSPIPHYQGTEGMANFASYIMRRVEAEVLADTLDQITGGSDLYTSAVPEPFTYIPKDMRAVTIADGSISSSFLTLFGRSARATGMENERVNELASPQWLYMLNSGAIQNKLQNGPKLAALIAAGGGTKEITERLYLTILSRFPTDDEVQAMDEYIKLGVAKGRDAWIDLAWALINSPEFLLKH
ncbi:MAG: hypothetical protein Kow0040_07800 [Thermogutta sp.]